QVAGGGRRGSDREVASCASPASTPACYNHCVSEASITSATYVLANFSYRGSDPGESSQRARVSCLRRPSGLQSPLQETAPGLAENPTVGRRPTARPVGASTGAGERVNYLLLLCSTLLCANEIALPVVGLTWTLPPGKR